MEKRIHDLLFSLGEIETQLSDPAVFADQQRYKVLTQEHARLNELKTVWEERLRVEKQLEESRAVMEVERDEGMVALLKEEIVALEAKLTAVQLSLENLLVPPDPNDSLNVILELRAGTGGEEAALFVADCVRMYQLYAVKMGWKCDPLSYSSSDLGGCKEYIMVVSGLNAKRFLQYEGGTHRVQRVPATEASGRIHTSAITIAVIVEPSEEEEIKIDEKDLRIDTFRSSGAGGQHVNVTDSAIRITHLPTGLVVACQQERSQHKNRATAMRLLKARLADQQKQQRSAQLQRERASQVGSGDRSERIRTYNFAQNRVTDHRIHLTLYNLKGVMEGELAPLTSALVAHYYQEALTG